MKIRIDKRVATVHLRSARRWGAALLLTLATLSSCSKPENPDPTPFDGRIRVVAGVAQSRAITDASTGITGAGFVVKESATSPASFSGAKTYTGNVAATSGKVTFTSTSVPTYNLNDAYAWFVAYAPGRALTNGAVAWTIDGKTDILVTNTTWNAGKYTAPTTTGLNFNHQLSQVAVVCKAEPTTTSSLDVVRAAWGKITKIEFLGAPTTMKYDLNAAPTVSTSGSANFELLADYNGTAIPATGFDIPANINTTANAVAMLSPVAPTTAKSFTLRITTTGATNTGAAPVPIVQTVNVSLDGSNAPMVKGKTHIVGLTFKADDKAIEVTSTAITPWGTGYAGSGEIEK